ncbi:UDP-3-O-(3-hydroxymyristoyl)glucosamine N-acyltransferase [Telmatospirillum sp.]|uniref:UDP-3-O-(3-hydroxymyristoyl)glucosamine N-acyltransferase n=1 Tax=Telmatospirillum sp. TaxID=2079197 RepID=UPI0028492253|nr:UDP-3-O-(3-hydroxymyristoyl)glucosamine N-acyltransferase [Telmatospirillum sp.]MDR3437489.1 UDP-3-O-(3-hydroxymyristoyl)glucosamine N-acyltransferase [Telmatospirillum sp.]
MRLSEIASALGAELVGGDDVSELEIIGVAGIKEAGSDQITFVANPKYAIAAKTTRAAAVIVEPGFPQIATPTLRTKNPYFAFARAVELFYQPPRYEPGVHPTAVVHPAARIGRNAHIGAYVVIDADVEIGDDAVLLPHVVIYRGARIGNNFFAHSHATVREYCHLGNNVILQNGAIVGADGFGFAKDDARQWHKIAQSGVTILEDDVEVQANACIDRASIGETRIRRGAKIDNFVQIGHGSEVGENSVLCARVGLAGSTMVGKNVTLAGGVGVAGHCSIGDGAVVTAMSGVPNDVEPGKVVSGFPAIENRQWLRNAAVSKHLSDMAKTVRRLSVTLEGVRDSDPSLGLPAHRGATGRSDRC